MGHSGVLFHLLKDKVSHAIDGVLFAWKILIGGQYQLGFVIEYGRVELLERPVIAIEDPVDDFFVEQLFITAKQVEHQTPWCVNKNNALSVPEITGYFRGRKLRTWLQLIDLC